MPLDESTPLPSEITSDARLKDLRPAHRIVMLCFLNGLKQTETAEYLGIHPNTVSHLWNSPSFRSLFEELDAKRCGITLDTTSQVRRKFTEHSQKAEEILSAIMEDETAPPSVRAACARDILDRAGHKPVENINISRPISIRVTDNGYNPEDDPAFSLLIGDKTSLTTQEKELNDLDALLRNGEFDE